MSAPTPPGGTSLRYRAEVDGLRAVAVIPVILFHAGYEMFGGGFVGVDVFFVISGYLITSLILTEIEAGRFSIAHFYERRARRILPALFCVTTATVPFAFIWLSPGDLVAFARSLIAVSLFSSNILFWRESGYFDTAAELKPLIHTWSLAVEEQYYILFPLLLMLLWKAGRRRAIGLLALIAAASLAGAHWAAAEAPAFAFYLLPTRAWEILLGSFVALREKDGVERRAIRPAIAQACSMVGLVLIAVAVFAFDRDTPFPSLYALVPTVGTLLVIHFARPGTLVHRLLASRIPVLIGLMSYSLYLWHQPLFAFAKRLTSFEPSPLLMGVLSVLVLPLSYATWRWVESPFRKRTNFTRRQIFTFATVGAVFSIAAGVGIQTSPGLQDRFQEQAYGGDVDHQEFNWFLESHYVVCRPRHIADAAETWKDLTRCLQSREGDPDLALVGDSHAEHLFIGFAERLKNRNVVYYIQDSVPVTSNPEFHDIFEHVMASRSIRTVVIAAHWYSRVSQKNVAETLGSDLLTTVDALVQSGKTVYLADDVPRFPFGPEMCKWIRWPMQGTTCDVDTAYAREDTGAYMPILEDVFATDPRIRRVHLNRHLCDTGGCSMVQDGLLLYRDHNHLNIDGSMWMASKVVAEHPELQELAEPDTD